MSTPTYCLRRFSRMIGCALLAVAVSWPQQNDTQELDGHLKKAQNDLDASNYADAAMELRAAIAMHPEIRGAYYQLGFALFQLHRSAEAEAAFTKELNFQPPDPYSLYYLGVICLNSGQRRAAGTFFERSLAAGEVLDVREKLAGNDLALGRIDDALRFLEDSVKLRPEDAGLHYLLGRAFKANGQVTKADAEFHLAAKWKAKFRNELVSLLGLRQALKAEDQPATLARIGELGESNDSDVLLAAATTLGQAGQHEKAIQFLQKEIAINPAISEAHYDLGRAYIALNQRPEAIVELQKANELKPNFYEAELLLGTLFADQGDGGQAIKHLRAAVRLRAEKPRLLTMLGLQYYQQNYFADAVDTLRKAINLDPQNPDPYYLLIEAYYRNFEYQHALNAARETVAHFPDSALAHYHLGAQLNNIGTLVEAKQQIDTALAEDPNLIEAKEMLGEVLFKLGKPEDSLVCFQQVLMVDPKLMNAQTGLGKALVQLKRYHEAVEAMEKAEQINSTVAPIHLYLSQAYRALGQIDDAKKEAAVFSSLNQERALARDRQGDRRYPD